MAKSNKTCKNAQTSLSCLPLVLFAFNVCLLKSAYCHATFYPEAERNKICYEPIPAKIYSWHIHVVYDQNHAKVNKYALTLLERFKAVFKSEIGAPCTGLFHQNRLCVFEPEAPAGPFPVAQWSIFLPIDQFASKVQWFMQNRVVNGTSLDVLVHPNSGCEVEDHTWWAFWGGEKWRLNVDKLAHDSPFPWTDGIN